MKRRLLSFIMLFAVTFCFVSGCKDEENGEQSVLVENGKEVVAKIDDVSYTANQLFGDLVDYNGSAEFIYEQLEDLLIKTAVNVPDSTRSRIKNEVEVWKKDIKENASISGTSYKEALASALEKEGVSSEEELIDKKIFAWQEETLTNRYWNETKDTYYNNYFSNRHVYHVSQILVSIGTNGNYDYFDVQPSTTVAKKIYNVANALLSGEDFYNVALLYSDDSKTQNNGGDMGMVTLSDASIPDEVKYALASYSIYVENKELLIGNQPKYLDTTYGNGIEAIPQKYIDKLGEVYDDGEKYISTSSDTTLTSRVYGRNVIFNNLFNSRTFRFLQTDGTENAKSMSDIKMPLTKVAGFELADENKNVIVNDEGNPILVVRSDSGIHFISIKKSAFVGSEELQKYYSTEINETDGYKTYLESVIAAKGESVKEETISSLESLAKDYATMKVSDNSNFAGNEDFIRYDMFKTYLNKTYNGVEFKITNTEIANIVDQYITAKKTYITTKMKNYFNENYELYANKAEYSDTELILKQIPILNCLEKDSDGKYACKYTYKNGFEVYSSTSGGATA